MKLEEKHYYRIAGGIIAGLGVALGLHYYYNKKNNTKALAQKTATPLKKTVKDNLAFADEQSYAEVNEADAAPQDFVLKQGSKGFEVKVVQQYINTTCGSQLKKEGLHLLKVDGEWGTKTTTAAGICNSLQRTEIDAPTYIRMARDLKAAGIIS